MSARGVALNESSLLERVRDCTPTRAPDRPLSLSGLLASVSRHLATMLNSREGVSSTAPGYGLPALSDMESGDELRSQALQRSMRDVIRNFEPRLREVTVRIVSIEEGDFDDPTLLHFEVDAVLHADGEHEGERVRFESHLADGRQWHCRAL